ncbi:MAG TPA: hypothetical protein VFM23_08790, partial [Gemmatimonadales bacterium]|nr:hypothetical protein [Gemmatimonadales bacterium]
MPIALIVLLAQSPDAPRFQTVTVYNSAFAFSLNDGALWAGRGWNQLVRAGVRARWGRVTLMLAPELVSSENRAYAVPSTRPYSIDLPERFGARGFSRLEPGQSTLALDLGAVTVGASTANEWWGPGIRNAIVLSNNAPGIWRGFVRFRRGNFSARWFLGGLFESPYFDTSAANDRRAISAAQVTWSTPT